MTYFLPPPLRAWPIMGEIDNPMARWCWIYDNVRQRSSINWIKLYCVRSCLALLSSRPTLISSPLTLDFQRKDQILLVILSIGTLPFDHVVFLFPLTPLRTDRLWSRAFVVACVMHSSALHSIYLSIRYISMIFSI